MCNFYTAVQKLHIGGKVEKMVQASPKRNILFNWLFWHFFEAPKGLLKAFWNFLVFNFNYFSIALLVSTLFSHWRRYRESYGRGFDFKVYFTAFTSNMISRTLGAFVRIVTIIIGITVEVFIFLGEIIAFLLWIFLPLLLILGLGSGIYLLLS